MFHEDVWSIKSYISPSIIEGNEEVVSLESNSNMREVSDPSVGNESIMKDTSSLSTSAHRKPIWLTHALHDAHEHIGALTSLMTVSIPARRYDNHIVLVTSICYPSSCFEEVTCDALMERNAVFGDNSFLGASD